MPSSTSSFRAASSEAATLAVADAGALFERPGFVRLTASDRPGVAQPVPERDIPPQPWARIVLGAFVLFVLLLAAWELYWRDFGATPGYRNSDGAWAEQRRRINAGEGDATVLIGASRMLFDVQLDQWQQATGERPIQLALEGTTPLPVLEDLAADPDFTGRLVVGVAPDIFFSGFAYRGEAIGRYHKQSPSQRIGHWLSQRLVEPWFAFYDSDFALRTVVLRQSWPLREGEHKRTPVRKLLTQDADRNTFMWRKVEADPQYRTLARSIWAERFNGPPPPNIDTPEKARKVGAEQIQRAAKAVAKLRSRGVPVVFVRPPSTGDYYAFEQKALPRPRTWDPLMKAVGVPGIHFEDYPQLQGLDQPEWSHLSHADAKRFTLALAPLVQRELGRQERVAAAPPMVSADH